MLTASVQPHKTIVHASWSPSVAQNVGINEADFRNMGLGALTPKQFNALLQWISLQKQIKADPAPQQNLSWFPALEQNYDITQKSFGDMGLGVLTMNQLVNVFTWVDTRELKAKKSIPMQVLDCGRPGTPLQGPAEAYNNVRVYVSANGKATQIISGVRERLRAMNGVEVVYTDKEADLTVSLVAMNVETVGGYQSGQAVSVDVTQPCALLEGGNVTASYDVSRDQFLEVGSNISSLVDDIASTIDTNDLDRQRKLNASYKQLLQDQKSK
jgi:hypothetical protein